MIANQPSPASIPLPLSQPLSPRNADQPRITALIDLFPDDGVVQDGFANRLREGLSVHLGQLRSIVDDDGSSRGSVVGDGVEEDTEEAENQAVQDEEAVPQESAPRERTISSTADSLYNAIRSPSPHPVSVLPQTNGNEEVLLDEGPQVESSSELSRMMARLPVIIPGPSGYTRSHPRPREPLEPDRPNGSHPGNTWSAGSQAPTSAGSTRPEHEWMSKPHVPLFGPGSLTSLGAAPTTEPERPAPVQERVSPPAELPEMEPSMVRVPSPVTVLYSSMERNRLESEALMRDLANTRRETALLERKCEELKELLTSLNLMPTGAQFGGMQEEYDITGASSGRHQANGGPEMRTTGALGLQTGTTPDIVPRNIPVQNSAREALAHVSRKLSLPMSVLTGSPISRPAGSPLPSDGLNPTSLDDVKRALDFVRAVNALVWKGRRPGGDRRQSASEAVFGPDNMRALTDRIQLWEKIVRNKR